MYGNEVAKKSNRKLEKEQVQEIPFSKINHTVVMMYQHEVQENCKSSEDDTNFGIPSFLFSL